MDGGDGDDGDDGDDGGDDGDDGNGDVMAMVMREDDDGGQCRYDLPVLKL
jgi:hypothetical protein